jgi:hypothetical protein
MLPVQSINPLVLLNQRLEIFQKPIRQVGTEQIKVLLSSIVNIRDAISY